MGILDSLFGSNKSKTKIPKWIEDASKRNVGLAETLAQIGYVPYYGPDVAAFTPSQEAAFRGTDAMADAFGMPNAGGATGMPQAQTFAGGVTGYSSAPTYEQALEMFKKKNPAQYDAIRGLFGNLPGVPQPGQTGAPEVIPTDAAGLRDYIARKNNQSRYGVTHGNGNGEWRAGGNYTGGSGNLGFGGGGMFGGYGGLRDMIDGGGPGASGDRFEGGGIVSDYANGGLREVVRNLF